jgi:hypothetical protein
MNSHEHRWKVWFQLARPSLRFWRNTQTLVIATYSKATKIVNGVPVDAWPICKIEVGREFAWVVFGVIGDKLGT